MKIVRRTFFTIIKPYLTLSFIANITSILAFLGISLNMVTIFQTKQDISMLTQKLDKQEAEQILRSYFFYLEQHDFQTAYNLLGADIVVNNPYTWYVQWLHNILSFEWLKINILPEKDSISQKVFLAEFGFKNKWEIVIDTKRWIYLKYDGKGWKINALSVLKDQNWRRKGACSFYNKFEICK